MSDQPDKVERWTWTQFPATRLEAARMVIPLACSYAPLSPLPPHLQPFEFDPQQCRTCEAVLNSYCQCDFRSLTWLCPLCGTKNNFPQQYSAINESNLPTELHRESTTVEYVLGNARPLPPPFYLFCIDLCVGSANPQDMEDLRETLLKALNFLPPDAIVGVITFGTAVSVHELRPASDDLPGRVFTLKGSKAYTTQQIAKFLRLNIQGPLLEKEMPKHAPGTVPNTFFARLSDVEMFLTELFEGLEPDPWPVDPHCRQRRCVGAAMSTAVGLCDALFPGSGGRIMLFLSGPCTEGPGLTVDTDLGNVMRGHNDIKGDTPEAKNWTKARTFYDELSSKLVRNGHCVDAFLNALDQVGFAEMRSCVTLTGGTCLLVDSYSNEKFVDAFKKFFRRNADGTFPKVYNARIKVQCSPQWKVAGACGPVTSAKKKSLSVSQDSEMGVGGTCEWIMPSVDDKTHLAFYFEVANTQKTGGFRFVQFTTRYQHCSGSTRLRVTTLCHPISTATRADDFVQCFDQETAAVLMARLASFKAEDGHLFDVLRWLDGHLIKLVAKFAKYERDNPSSLTLAPQLSLFPQFIFHLRRSQFLQVFNSSPDETCFFRLWLDRESPTNALVMIQPALYSYDSSGGPRPCLLDSTSVTPDCILVLDTYFEVVVHYGESIVAWREAGYQNQPNYEYFKRLLEQPVEEAMKIVKARYPQPRFVECDHHGSQARLLYNVINPSKTHQDGDNYGGGGGEIVYTDDASLQTFLDHLKKLAVQ
eukprot:TRINITY_DN8785_c0_g1_i1.p1 TRINITY_DN8785_c0_g1~~TRINITY_DN8785_c0_g1_i1.p1  ORF type:complete len:779 (+),score=229.87 TRINITY_DN8785_c0_g1_i1:61-2337(+)